MQFEYDPERLIEEVRKRPGIWDFDDVNYRTKEIRHKLWTEVVVELLHNVKVTKSEMRELGNFKFYELLVRLLFLDIVTRTF